MKTVRLGEVAQINPRAERLPADEPVSFVGMAQLDADRARAVPLDTRPYGAVAKGYTQFADGDLLAAKITPCWENGKVGVADLTHRVGVGSTEFHVIRCGERVHDRYLLHFLRQAHVRASGELRMTGSGGQRRVPAQFLADLLLPLPEPPEQQRIAAILDQAGAVRANRRQVLDRLERIQGSALRTLLDKHEAMDTTPLGDHLSFLTSGSRGWAKYYTEAGTPFIRIQNVKGTELLLDDLAHVTPPNTAEADRTLVSPGDVLLSITADLGRTAVIPADLGSAYINQHLAILRTSNLSPTFLAGFLESPVGRRQLLKKNKGASKAGLNFDDVRSVAIPNIPRDIQEEFSTLVDAIRIQRQNVQLAGKRDDEIFASLQSRAFRGEL